MKVSQIVIELLTACNFNCPYCRDASGEKKNISLDDAKNLVDTFAELGVNKVQLDGGETFLYKDIFELIQYIVSKNMEVGIYSNASVITEEMALRLAEFSSIKLCVTIHPLNSQDQIESTFTGIANLKSKGIYPQIVYVVSSKSYEKLPEILERLPKGKYKINLNPIVQSGRAVDNGVSPLSKEQSQEFVKIVEKSRKQYPDLDIIDNVLVKQEELKIENIQMNADGEFALHINTDGYVLPFFSADNSTAIGNVNDLENLKKTMKDKETIEYLEKCRIAMKKRIEGEYGSNSRKIERSEIVKIV